MAARRARFCGIDWATTHHDYAVVDAVGEVLAQGRVANSADGLRDLLSVLDSLGTRRRNIPVAIETSREMITDALVAAGQLVHVINPAVAARYRGRVSPAKKRKSDRSDALLLANILRTDLSLHRQLSVSSPQAQAITVLARAQQDMVYEVKRLSNEMLSVLRVFHPGAAEVLTVRQGGLSHPDSRAVLAAGPTPALAARLRASRVEGLLRQAGRTLRIGTEAARIREGLMLRQWRRCPQVEEAMGQQALSLLDLLNAACHNRDRLAGELIERFEEHPYARIITSFPGVGALTGARLLGELGDDPGRFSTARGLRAYAGAAPLTWASGSSHQVFARRHCKNRRLAGIGHQWAFCAIVHSPGARDHYDRRREVGDRHPSALRNLFGRLLSGLHHCLRQQVVYSEKAAFPHHQLEQTEAAGGDGS